MELFCTFYPQGNRDLTPFSLPFSPQGLGDSPLSLWGTQENALSTHAVYSDVGYQLKLTFPEVEEGESIPSVTSLEVFVNDQLQLGSWDSQQQKITFPPIHGGENCIFLDCFGYATVSLRIKYSDYTIQTHQSCPLPVRVQENAVSRSVQAMANYLFEKQDSRLMRGKFREKNFNGDSHHQSHTLESRIALAEEILASYETQVAYFQSNCRFKMVQVDVVDRMEKLQQITPRTMSFIAQHPEYLKKVRGTIGFAQGNQVYLPEKTLITQNVYSKDIYENKVVVSFLHKMQEDLKSLEEEIQLLSANHPQEETEDFPWKNPNTTEDAPLYIDSHRCILNKMTHVLESTQDTIQSLQSRFQSMTLQYHKILNFPLEYFDTLETTPKPTAVLLSVPQYYSIYRRMHQWFHEGSYDFGKEQAMLSSLNISDLYEQYLLMKFVEYFRAKAWEEGKFYQQTYGSSTHQPTLANLSATPNTFQFHKGDLRVTLFYQPNVYDSDRNYWNGAVGLYRNNNNSLHQDKNEVAKGTYYQPDFIFKVETPEGTRFIIADAKFSTLYRVKQHYLLPLLYKYLFSLTPINPKDKISGLAVFYGKCIDQSPQESAYNKQIAPIYPFTELFPMVEGVQTDQQYAFLDKMLEF